METRTIARLHALGRVAFGAGLAFAPGVVAGAWVGAPADRRGVQVLAIAMGGRDMAIGLGAFRAIGQGRGGASWVRAGMLADSADLAATIRAGDELPPFMVPAVGALAAGSVLLGAWLQAALD
jgi:hypothetical protein